MFDPTKNKLDCYKGEDSMKRFCKDLREHAMDIINYEKSEMIPLTNEENEPYNMQKVCYICKEIFSTDKNDENVFKLCHEVRDHCHYTGEFRGAAHNILIWDTKHQKKFLWHFIMALHMIITS